MCFRKKAEKCKLVFSFSRFFFFFPSPRFLLLGSGEARVPPFFPIAFEHKYYGCVCVFGGWDGGWSGRFPLAAQRGLLGAFPSIFIFSCRPRGHAVRFRGRRSAIFLLFSVGPLHLVVFSLGWTRFLNLWRTGPRLPSRPPFPLMAGVGPVPAAACAVPCCEGIAAGQRACACVRGADA